jgi:hypothetical protein
MNTDSSNDQYVGLGGSYTVDPATGVKTRTEGTLPAPTAQELIDQAAAAAEAGQAAEKPTGRRSRSAADEPASQS